MDLAELIKERVRITDLLDRMGIEMNRSGFVSSPFRSDSTPSCKIYPKTDSWCDHGDSEKRGGSVIDFYMAYYNVDVATAIKEVASLFGLSSDVIATDRKPAAKTVFNKIGTDVRVCLSGYELEFYEERIGIAGELVALNDLKLRRLEVNTEIYTEFVYYCLGKGWLKEAHSYLVNDRVLSELAIERFELVSIRNYNEVNNHMKKNFDIGDLQRSGLFNLKEDGTGNLIFYNHRIIIPYKFNNKIVYLRGRYFTEGTAKVPEGQMKYLGLRNDELNLCSPKRFFNSDVLKQLLKFERLYLVEGEFDCIALSIELNKYCIGIPGAGNLPGEKVLMKLLNHEIIICGDDDAAGAGLVNKLLEFFQKYDKTVGIKTLPGAKDVNEFLIKQSA